MEKKSWDEKGLRERERHNSVEVFIASPQQPQNHQIVFYLMRRSRTTLTCSLSGLYCTCYQNVVLNLFFVEYCFLVWLAMIAHKLAIFQRTKQTLI